ncbi:MAG: metallophosphoesterase family protein [Solirubrobacterales bacterium]
MRAANRARRRARVAAFVCLVVLGIGSSQAGAGGLQVESPAAPEGGFADALSEALDQVAGAEGEGPGACPKVLAELGLCKRPDHGHGPQEDFTPYDGKRKRSPRDWHAHDHVRGHAHDHDHGAERRGAAGAPASGETLGKTTLEQTIEGTGDPSDGFQTLRLAPGEGRIVREDLAEAKQGRAERRVSLLYAGQTTDWQLVDEESPARVEFLDIAANPPLPSAVSAAWRPQEALGAFAVDESIRQLNEFVDRSPVTHRGGRRAEMEMALMTGDQADNQQLNETEWVLRLLEGGTLDPNSGTDPSACPPGQQPSGQTADPALYAGVQDYDDYAEGLQFYDPDQPAGPKYSDWPRYPGLMDRAQVAFQARGLDVPTYVAVGNHDQLAQGNEKALLPFELVAVGCIKPMVPVADLTEVADVLDPEYLAELAQSNPSQVMFVPPDDRRQYVDKRQYKQIFLDGEQPDGYGFGLVDQAELEASNGAAAYYAWTHRGIRMIGLDTLCEGGVVGPASNGNLDDPQYRWLERELEGATERDQLVVVFGHHPIRSLDCNIPDETPPPCTIEGEFGHDLNPGCDVDPRSSQPIHDGASLTALFHRFPHVIAYVAGHTHEHALSGFDREEGGSGDFWGIETASLIDWPPQNRLIELMDNCDGTLSIFGTTLDGAAPATAAGSGAEAAGMSSADLASISRTLAFNDPQAGAGSGEGEPEDRNVELLIDDPRSDPTTCDRDRKKGLADRGDGGEEEGEARPTATAAAGTLPFTGLVLGGLLIAGLALLSIGGLARRFAARRR